MAALTDYDVESLRKQLACWGHNPAHALPLLRQFYLSGGDVDLSKLAVGKALERRMAEHLPLRQSRIVRRCESSDGTVKLLVGLHRGGSVEAVLMPAHRPDRAAGCVSSQVGCAMGCDFCASTKGGLERNLEAGEIVEQFLHLRKLARDGGRRLATLVFMGIGEPMHNLDNVMAAIQRIAAPDMGELGGRQITVSTVGIVPGIDRLAEAGLNVHLAVSLHAPEDETRARLVPANRRWGVREIVEAARRFQQETGRIVTIEYCMLDGVNDSSNHAAALAALLEGFRAHVNLIPYKSIGPGLSGTMYRPSPPQRLGQFVTLLRARRVVVHVRLPRGQDIQAACGQLRGTDQTTSSA